MRRISIDEKIELVKNMLKELHRGASVEELKEKYREVLSTISPIEIPIIEQELVREGVSVREILHLCDLHVELFREQLASRQLTGIPAGHPLDVLLQENEWLNRRAEILKLYATNLKTTSSRDDFTRILASIRELVTELRKIRLHYRKIQMGIFPYLERRGIVAVPRVMWGREDQTVVAIRSLSELLASDRDVEEVDEIVGKALEVSQSINDLVFRENKILYPTTWALFSEGEWVAIKEVFDDIGYIVEPREEWRTEAKPILPYELESTPITPDQLEKLPMEMRGVILSRGAEPDKYRVVRDSDIDLGTGFLSIEDIENMLNSLPLEITYASADDRVRYFNKSFFSRGFLRTKTIIGRRLEYCHPPRLEKLVTSVVEELKRGERRYAEYWTKLGDRIIRVLVVAVRNSSGEYIGTLEIVEDLTEVVKNPEKILNRIVVL